jgi:vitamin B12 transporter
VGSSQYAQAGWKVGSSLLAASDRFDNAVNTVRLGGFATLDLYAERALSRAWSLQGRLNNLADKQYQTAQGYNQPGRAAYLSVRYRPQ